jgi:hypothetical protein
VSDAFKMVQGFSDTKFIASEFARLVKNLKTFPVSTPIAAGDRVQGFTKNGEASPIMFIAPIDLKIDDRCTININDGYLFLVERKGKVVWNDNNDWIPTIPSK